MLLMDYACTSRVLATAEDSRGLARPSARRDEQGLQA